MIGAGIFPSDIAIVDRSLVTADIRAMHDKIVMAVLDGEFTIKRLCVKGKVVSLVPENEKYQPIAVTRRQRLHHLGRRQARIRHFSEVPCAAASPRKPRPRSSPGSTRRTVTLSNDFPSIMSRRPSALTSCAKAPDHGTDHVPDSVFPTPGQSILCLNNIESETAGPAGFPGAALHHPRGRFLRVGRPPAEGPALYLPARRALFPCRCLEGDR